MATNTTELLRSYREYRSSCFVIVVVCSLQFSWHPDKWIEPNLSGSTFWPTNYNWENCISIQINSRCYDSPMNCSFNSYLHMFNSKLSTNCISTLEYEYDELNYSFDEHLHHLKYYLLVNMLSTVVHNIREYTIRYKWNIYSSLCGLHANITTKFKHIHEQTQNSMHILDLFANVIKYKSIFWPCQIPTYVYPWFI